MRFMLELIFSALAFDVFNNRREVNEASLQYGCRT